MAKPFAISAVARAVLSLLEAAVPRDEVRGFPNAKFEMYQASNFVEKNVTPEGIGVYVYRLAPANNVRNTAPRSLPDGKRIRPSMAIDIHFLLVAFAADAYKQHRLLGWAIRAIEDMPILPSSLLNLAGPEETIFGEAEAVDVVMENLSAQELNSIWDAAQSVSQLAAPYVVRMIELESELEMHEHPPVQTRVFGMGDVAP